MATAANSARSQREALLASLYRLHDEGRPLQDLGAAIQEAGLSESAGMKAADFLVGDGLLELKSWQTPGVARLTHAGVRAGEEITLRADDVAEELGVADDAASTDPRRVFVIHGRDEEAREALFSFLQDLDLHPIQWEELVRSTGKGAPYNAEVVAQAFREAQAVVALFTPDDEARLHMDLRDEDEPHHERTLTGQARPNVFLEAGMALQAQPDRTIFVEIGRLRPASDLSGMNAVRLGGSSGPLLALVQRLKTAGCQVNQSNPNWMNHERFKTLSAVTRRPREAAPAFGSIPLGQRLGSEVPAPAAPSLTARLHPRGRDYLLEVVNRGGVTLKNVRWEFAEVVTNWHVLTEVLPEYPILEMPPRDHVRVPVTLTLGGPAVTDITLLADQDDGSTYSVKVRLSIYG